MSILRKYGPQPAPVSATAASVPRYAKPKILAIDLSPTDETVIRDAGFNVRAGSFGTPVQGSRSDRYLPVPVNGSLPNLTEQELIVADLERPVADAELAPGEDPVDEGMWQRMDSGVLDPRPYLMHVARNQFERIFAHGGAYILFASPRERPPYEYAAAGSLGYGHDPYADNWGLLSALSVVDVVRDHGSEITAAQGLMPELAAFLEAGSFTCTVEPDESAEARWTTLASNKYGKPVAGMLVPENDHEGCIFVLPRVAEKGAAVTLLLQETLPRLAPRLFPEDERQAWTGDEAYALPGVVETREQIADAEVAAEKEMKALHGKISEIEAEHGYLHELLTATGDELVAAVKKTLESIGFQDVRDIDYEEGPKDGRLGEDLQIWRDPQPVVLVEVKGINGLPRDGDVFQVQKNVLPRSREWERFDVRALTVVNHERGLPPLDRQQQPFQKAQIDNAEGENLGLMTTWDLYRLARGYARNGWKPDDLAGLLAETSGLVVPLPAHYDRIGEVTNYFEQPGVIAVQLDHGTGVAVGERIGFSLSVEFIEECVPSLEIEGNAVDPAPPGTNVGIKTALTKKQARPGTPVYRVGRQ